MPNEAAHPIFEYSQVDDRIFIGTNACCQMHFSAMLSEKGITSDISLEAEQIDQPFGVETYLWLPTLDHQPPSLRNTFIGITSLESMLESGHKVYIHCKNGHGRAPTFYAAYLVVQRGMKPSEAIALLAAKRPSMHLETSQRTFLDSLTK